LRIEDPTFSSLVNEIITSTNITLYGFYSHAGNSYASKNSSEAITFLSGEIDTVNKAALIALDILKGYPSAQAHSRQPFVLSVGSTPTAHAVSAQQRSELISKLSGTLELHAGKFAYLRVPIRTLTTDFIGNYPMLDLQQEHTGLITTADISQKIISTVISIYPGRGLDGTDEALCDAGAIALSKDTGPKGGFGDVIGKHWRLVRISQEHGILGLIDAANDDAKLSIGERVEIIGQHACLIAAAHPFYYITDTNVDQGRTVVDVWVPWKGW
jgi:D-serine ammonia-lyase